MSHFILPCFKSYHMKGSQFWHKGYFKKQKTKQTNKQKTFELQKIQKEKNRI